MHQCDRVDPLDFQENEVLRDTNLLPRIDLADIKDYFANATSFATREQLKAHKGNTYCFSFRRAEGETTLASENAPVFYMFATSPNLHDVLVHEFSLNSQEGIVTCHASILYLGRQPNKNT